MMISRKFILKGRVQGVGFRFFTTKNAEKFGITGSVKNLTNGNVEVYAKGDKNKLEDFKAKLIKGNSFSRVEEIEEYEVPEEKVNDNDFHVRY
ncbi:MAG: acylphosphatase [Thermotogota bacterium]